MCQLLRQNKMKHEKRQSYIPGGFRVHLNSSWYLKYWFDGWKILGVPIRYLGIIHTQDFWFCLLMTVASHVY